MILYPAPHLCLLCFCAFELAVASCTPLVAKFSSHLSRFTSLSPVLHQLGFLRQHPFYHLIQSHIHAVIGISQLEFHLALAQAARAYG